MKNTLKEEEHVVQAINKTRCPESHDHTIAVILRKGSDMVTKFLDLVEDEIKLFDKPPRALKNKEAAELLRAVQVMIRPGDRIKIPVAILG